MSSSKEVRIPDLGGAEKVRIVELLVRPGDRVRMDDGLLTLESDKASMDVPAPEAGLVTAIHVAVGAEVNEGDVVITLETGTAVVAEQEKSEVPLPEPAQTAESPPPGDEVMTVTTAQNESVDSSRIETEVVVLGAGPGGYTAAFRAADLGKRVTLVERDTVLGGVCLNVGCIPSKALLHVAKVMEEAKDLADHGVDFGRPQIDVEGLRSYKQGVVDRLTKGLAGMAKQRGVTVVRGEARFTSPQTMAVQTARGEHEIRFVTAIIAAGSRVIELPGFPWDDPRVMDSTAALELADVPKRLLLVGGGIIGLEMAMVYGALGSQLTIVEMLDGLIPGCDADLVRPLQRRLQRRYKAEIHLGTKVAEVKALKRGLKATFEGDKAPGPQMFDRILVAVGRRPNGDRLGAEAAGVHVDERGFIRVDRRQRTNVPHIFAVGDLTGQPMLAHKATHEAKVAAEVAAGMKSGFDARVIPSVAYTDPEIAWVGLTETQAVAEGRSYQKAVFPWSASGRSLGMGRNDGSTKILFDPSSHRILGAGIVGPNAGDLIAELGLAIEMDCEAGDLALTIHPHPTLAETVGLAAEVYEGTITDLYLGKKRPRR